MLAMIIDNPKTEKRYANVSSRSNNIAQPQIAPKE